MRKITVLTLAMCLTMFSLIGCGNTESKTEETETVQEESTTEETAEAKSEDKVKIVDNGLTLAWVDDDMTNVGVTAYLRLQNLTEDKIAKSIHYQVTAKKGDGTVIETGELYCDFIAPGEVGILTTDLELKYDDMNDENANVEYACVSAELVDADDYKYVPQSSVEISGVNAEKTELDTKFRGSITNNGDTSMQNATVIVVASKDGKVESVVSDYLMGETIEAGASRSFEISGTSYMSDDYDNYEVYVTSEL